MSETNFEVPSGKQEVIITRLFDAPRDLVFKAYTDATLIPQWWGPAEYKTTIDKLDVKQGGIWRFVQSNTHGEEFAFHGVYHEVLLPERLVFTFEFEGMPGHVLMQTVWFEDVNGKTKITDKSVYQSIEDRDGMVAMGMESGAREGVERLDALLKNLS